MVEMRIEYDEQTGAVTLNGPLDNRLLCYGLLEMAKEIVASNKPRATPRIVPGVAPVLPPLRRQ